MRWNCPHCQKNLAIADEKLGTGWNFSSCHHCKGFALLKRPEAFLIKLERDSTGNHILISGDPRKAVIPPPFNHAAPTNSEPTIQRSAPQLGAVPLTSIALGIPDPLPEVPVRRSSGGGYFNSMIGIAGICAIAYSVQLQVSNKPLSANTAAAPRAEAKSITASAIAPSRAPAVVTALAQNEIQNEIQDEIQHDAMSAERPPTDHQGLTGERLSARAFATIQEDAQAIAEKVSEPTPSTSDDSTQKNLIVQALTTNVKLRTGPGTGFSSVGYATPETRYPVSEWSGHWFKIEIEPDQHAWVRNDLVQLVQE